MVEQIEGLTLQLEVKSLFDGEALLIGGVMAFFCVFGVPKVINPGTLAIAFTLCKRSDCGMVVYS